MQAADVLAAVAIGAGATALTDLWNLLLKRALGLPSLNLCLLGRWVSHMPAGTFRHASLARVKSLMTHTVFGVGLWACALAVNALLRGRA